MITFGCRKIGVLGGIGPEATAEFYAKLIASLQQSGRISHNTDYPQIVINSIPAPSLTRETVTDEDLLPYLKGLEELERNGVDFIAMVCNTIHLFLDILQRHVHVPIIDLRVEVKRTLREKGIRSCLVLGTPMTTGAGLYRFEDVQTHEPTEEEQKQLTGAIEQFNAGINKELHRQGTEKLCRKYLAKGVRVVILGCTEFGVMLKERDIPSVNTIDVLVDATIRRIYGS